MPAIVTPPGDFSGVVVLSGIIAALRLDRSDIIIKTDN